MTLDAAVKISAIVQSLVTIIAIAVGGWWTYRRFISQRERDPRAHFDVDLAFVGTQGDYWLVEVSACVENKGLVRHPVNDFKLSIRYLLDDEEIMDGDEGIKFQVQFPHSIDERIGKSTRWLWTNTYIDPGVTHRNSYVTSIPIDATFVLLQGSFLYGSERFTAQRLLKVPDGKASSERAGI